MIYSIKAPKKQHQLIISLHGWITGFTALDNMLDGIPKPTKAGRAIGLAGAPQHGKLLTDDTLVPTPKGFVNHGDLKKGDMVYGRNGKPIKVLNVFPKDMATCKVTFSDGEQIYCHENHEWVVHDTSAAKKGTTGERTVETKYLESVKLRKGPKGRGGRYRFQVDAPVAIQSSEKALPVHPYTLGVWLGDGKSNTGVICHHRNDLAHIQKIKMLEDTLVPGEMYMQAETAMCYSPFKGLITKLRKLGVKNNKHIPQKYLLGSIEQRLELLAGLVDSDGYIYQKNGRICFSNTNKHLVEDAADLVRSLGSRATVTEFEPKDGGTSSDGAVIVGQKVVYRLTFNLDLALPTVLPRKIWEGRHYEKRSRSIVSVERVAPKQGNCIQVEGGVYLVGKNLIPTHNSAIMLNIKHF